MSSPNPLDHTDDANTLLAKMMQATNEVVKLNEELVKIGTELNKWRGVYNEIKARIKTQKEIINSLKVAIRAEASQI